ELPVDAIFSPIRRVNYTVDRARVDQRTNYDKLIIDIWTHGTIRPDEARNEAARTLMKQLSDMAGPMDSQEFAPSEVDTSDAKRAPHDQLYEKLIEELDLSVRVFNSLKRTGITTIGDVLDMLDRGPEAMLAIRNFGEKSLEELVEKLKEKGYLDE